MTRQRLREPLVRVYREKTTAVAEALPSDSFDVSDEYLAITSSVSFKRHTARFVGDMEIWHVSVNAINGVLAYTETPCVEV